MKSNYASPTQILVPHAVVVLIFILKFWLKDLDLAPLYANDSSHDPQR